MNIAQIPLPMGSHSGDDPSAIVVHAIAEYIDTEPHDYHAVNFLAKINLSAHAFITPSGVIIRSRADHEGAYHAKGFNDGSLGIEFLVPGVHTYETFRDAIKRPYLTEVQYQAGLGLVDQWMSEHNISIGQVYRHSDISPKRKIDPGAGFPWEKFNNDLRALDERDGA